MKINFFVVSLLLFIQAFSRELIIETLNGRDNVDLTDTTLTVGQNNEDSTYSGVISGSGTLIKTGTGTLVLKNTNTYSLGTSITGNGAISIHSDGNLGERFSQVNLNNGKLIFSGSFQTLRNLNLQNQGLIETAGIVNYYGSISGSGDLVKLGQSILTLNSIANTYSGLTIVSDGVLQAGIFNAFSPNSEILVNSSGTLDLGFYDNTIPSIQGSGFLSLGSGRLTVGNQSDSIFSGLVFGSGGITKKGSGSLVFSGNNSYQGSTNIDEGSLTAGFDAVFSENSAVIIGDSLNATLNLNGYNNTILSLSGGGKIYLGTATLTLGDSENQIYSGSISGSGGILYKGSGLFQLNGPLNTYSGKTEVTCGILQSGCVNAFSPNSIVELSAYATLDLNSHDNQVCNLRGRGNVLLNSGVLTLGNEENCEFFGSISGSGGITKIGSSNLKLSGLNSYFGNTVIQGGSLESPSFNSSVIIGDLNGAELKVCEIDTTIISLSGSGKVSLDTAVLTFGDSNSQVYSGVISGSGGIRYKGEGTFQLSGNNTYTGETRLVSGTLKAGAVNSFSPNSVLILETEATLDLNGYSNSISNLSGNGTVSLKEGTLTLRGNQLNSEFSGKIIGSGVLTKRGAGSLLLSGLNSYTGTTNVFGGSLLVGQTNALSESSVLSLSSGAVFDLNSFCAAIGNLTGSGKVRLSSASLTIGGNDTSNQFSGEISGSGSIIKRGLGSLTLSGSNSYVGMTSILEGSLTSGKINSFSVLSEVNLASGTGASLNLSGYDNTILNLSGCGEVRLGSGVLTFGDSNTTGFFGSILGSGGITKQGSGTIIFYGSTNTYSGLTTINEGTIRAGDTNVLSQNSEIVLLKPASLNSNGYNNTISNLSGNGSLILDAGTVTIGNSHSKRFSGSISGSGGITKVGSGTLTISGESNSYSGLTTINGGIIESDGENSLSSSSKIAVNRDGILKINGFNNRIANLFGNGSVVVDLAILTLGDEASSGFSGSISGSGGIAKIGLETFILTGTNNTYSGPTIINEGTLLAKGVNVFSPNSQVVLNNQFGVALDLGNNDNIILSLSGIGQINLGSGILTVGDKTNTVFSGSISSLKHAGGLTKQGEGILSLKSSSNIYNGPTKVLSGTLQAVSENAFSPHSSVSLLSRGSLDLNGYNNTIKSLSGENESLVTLGSGVLTVSGSNVNSLFEGSISGSGGIRKIGDGVLTLTGNNTYLGVTEISDGGTIAIESDSNLSGTFQINLNNGTIRATGENFTLSRNVNIIDKGTILSDIELTISGGLTGTGELLKAGSGNVHIVGSGNTFSGITTILDGSLHVDCPSVFSSTACIHLCDHSHATLNLTRNNHEIGSISGSGTVNLDSATLTINSENDAVFDGIISGSGSLTKNGSGLLNLTGNHTYSGKTLINSGTLSINGSVNSQVTIGENGRLQGSGSINSNLISHGRMAPGNSIGPIIVIGDVTYSSSSIVEIEVTPSLSDTIIITGDLTIDSGATLEIIPLQGNYPPLVTHPIIFVSSTPFIGSFTHVDYTIERATGTVEYLRNHPDIGVTLLLNLLNYQEVAQGSNRYNVAWVLDQISKEEITSWNEALNNLFYLNNSELNDAFNKLCPSELKGLAITQQNNAVRIQDAISYRFQAILDDCNNRKGRTYLWADGIYSTLHQGTVLDDSNLLTGYKVKTSGGTLGFDFNFLTNGYMGFMGAGTSSNVHFEDSLGNANIYTGYIGIYGSYIGNGPFLNSSLLTGWNTYKATRNIDFSGVDLFANNEHRGTQFLAHLDFGWNFVCPGFKIRPFDSIDYILQHENGFHEELAGVFDLEVASTNPQMIRNELGLNFAKCFQVSKKNTLVADVKLSWVLENRFNGKKFVSNFNHIDEPTFETDGYFPNRSLFSPGVSLTANFCEDRAYISANYDAEIGDNYRDQVFIGQIGLKF